MLIPRTRADAHPLALDAPLWAIGFRPFYTGAALFGALALCAWVANVLGAWSFTPALSGMNWHAHEMVFGFAPAVIVGFLLTAVCNWTNLPTARGGPLAALFALWLAGRGANALAPAAVAAAIDPLFLLAAAMLLARPLLRARNRRNYFVPALLLVLAAANALHHAACAGVLPWHTFAATPSELLRVALDMVALLVTVIGGRVIPSFTSNALPAPKARTWREVEYATIGAMLVLALLDLVLPAAEGDAARQLVAFAAAALHGLRLLGWRAWRTLRIPLLAMLPLGYAWLPVHLVLRGLDAGPPALHALAVGAMCTLMLAMMMRSALGHTGRALEASAVDVSLYAFMQVAAVLRVFGPLALPGAWATWIGASGAFAALSFGLFAARYGPMLLRPRVDGRPG